MLAYRRDGDNEFRGNISVAQTSVDEFEHLPFPPAESRYAPEATLPIKVDLVNMRSEQLEESTDRAR